MNESTICTLGAGSDCIKVEQQLTGGIVLGGALATRQPAADFYEIR